MGLVAPGPPGFTGRAREESETREGFELPAIDVSSSRKVFAHPCAGGVSGRVCGVQGTTVGTVPPWRTRGTGVVGSGMMGGHACDGHSDLLAIASHCKPLLAIYLNLSGVCRTSVGRRLAIPDYLVRRYFCRRLFGLSGIVLSTRPASSAGVPVVFSEVHSVRDTCRSH